MNRQLLTLFFVMFLASFDMHAQMPLLSPYVKSLGASAMMIGVILSAYSTSNLIGNLIAGPFLDKYRKPLIISTGLFIAGLLLILQGVVTEISSFLVIRFLFGFVMAFVTPACFAMLGEMGKTEQEQGSVMAKNGIVMTIASMISPAIGGMVAGHFGYQQAFYLFGLVMIFACLLVFTQLRTAQLSHTRSSTGRGLSFSKLPVSELFLAYLAGFTVLYAQGTLLYEIPLLMEKHHLSPLDTGNLFSLMGVGSLVILSMFWLHRISPGVRCLVGLTLLGLVMYSLALDIPISLYIVMLCLGISFGILFPAMSTILASRSPKESYGVAFSIFSAVLSVGAMISPLVSGYIDQMNTSFFLAFLLAFIACILSLLQSIHRNKNAHLIPR